MTFTLGAVPKEMQVELCRDADFFQTMHTESGGPWPLGTSIEIRFPDGTVWPAAIVADEASWNVDKAEVDAVINTDPVKAQLYYVNGALDALWATGAVTIRD